MLHEPSTFAAKFEAEPAPRLREPPRAPAVAPPRTRWPLKWTIVGAVIASGALWVLIFAGVRALWSMLAG